MIRNFLEILEEASVKMIELNDVIINQLDHINQAISQHHILENWSPYNRLSKLIKLKENLVEVDIEFHYSIYRLG